MLEILIFVFSETLTIAQFNSEFAGNENIEILNSDDNLITFQQRNIYLKENDVIFCNSSRIELLFYYLSKVENLRNLKLITHQTDLPIEKNYSRKNQKCVEMV